MLSSTGARSTSCCGISSSRSIVFFATMALTVAMAIEIPKGFFPIQDTGLILGLVEGAQDVSPEEMMRLQQTLGDILLNDPDIAAFGSVTGSRRRPDRQYRPLLHRAQAARRARR